MPLREQGFDLNKKQFRDALSLRYNIPLEGLPSTCACGDTFNVPHALSCKNGWFVAMRHDNIRDILTSLLGKVCKDVKSEPHLIPLENEVLHLNMANRSEEACLDIKANGSLQHCQTSFFDIRVIHVNAMSNRNKSTKAIFRNHELAKKPEYMERVLETASSTGARSLSPGDRVSKVNERLPENELQMAAITFMQHGTHWPHSSKTT